MRPDHALDAMLGSGDGGGGSEGSRGGGGEIEGKFEGGLEMGNGTLLTSWSPLGTMPLHGDMSIEMIESSISFCTSWKAARV